MTSQQGRAGDDSFGEGGTSSSVPAESTTDEWLAAAQEAIRRINQKGNRAIADDQPYRFMNELAWCLLPLKELMPEEDAFPEDDE